MTQEEKARSYDKAIEKIKYVMEHDVQPVLNKEDLQDIFPELKESEDERIRKALIEYFKRYKEIDTCGSETFSGIPTDNILAWLEKQGEQKFADWSEEDEHRLEDTIYFLDTAKKHYASTVELDACIDWTNSIKQRMEEQQ